MTERKPTEFELIQKQFSTDEACRKYLFQLKWPTGFICPDCGCREYYLIKTRQKYQCKNCRHQASVTVGTVMDRSHISMQTWIWAIYLVSKDKRGSSAAYLSRELNISYKTSWFLLHRIRHAMVERDSRYTLLGIVEMDDAFFGAAKKGSKRGRGTSKTKVIVALSKDEDDKPLYAKMQVVKDLKSPTIAKFAEKNIVGGSIVHTDAYSGYRKPMAAKYLHRYGVYDPDSEMLKWLHIVIGNSKSFVLGTFHGLGKKHLQRYLDRVLLPFQPAEHEREDF